jgi:hypothetical protein
LLDILNKKMINSYKLTILYFVDCISNIILAALLHYFQVDIGFCP